ncbi:MAG: hypothetical protein JWM11_4843 [Planctomycetaceae bacterium]|nr:hypothetical protein [Planctomycetaceae bacterium]
MFLGWSVRALGLGCLLFAAGCGGNQPAAKGTESEVKQIGIVYMRYLGSHQGKSPANREELDKFLEKMSPADLKTMGIANAKDVFISSRDKSEIVVRYGIEVPPPGPGKPTVVAYEQKGVGGKHLVVYGTAGVEEITNAKLKELVPDVK